jgi:branched-chain amino acid transport system ATP-binding protein
MPLEEAAPDRDRLRRLVPTSRQLAEGAEFDVAPFEAEFDQLDVLPAKPGLVRRVAGWFDSVNPLKIEGPKLPLVICSFAGFIAAWEIEAAKIVGPEIQAEFGVSIAALATVGSVAGTLGIVLGLPMGYIVDRVKRVWIMRITNLVGALGAMIQSFAPTYGAMLSGRAVAVAGLLPESGATFPYMADSYSARARARVFAIYAAAGTSAGLIAPPIVGAITKYYGWRATTFSVVFLCGTAMVLAFMAREPIRGAMDRQDLGVDEELVNIEEEAPSMGEALKGAWGIKTLRLTSIALFVFGFTSVLNIVDANVQAGKFGLDPFQRSLILTAINGVSLPAVILGGSLADRLLARRPSSLLTAQAVGAFLSAAALFATGFAPNLPVYVVLYAVPVIMVALMVPASNVVRSLVVPSRYRGIGMQIGSPFSLITILMGPVILSTFVHGTDLQRVYVYFAPFFVVAGLIYLAAANSFAGDMRAALAAAAARLESEESRRARQNKVLVCRDIDVAIDEVQILFRIDLDIREGEVVALVGTNGAGKSTLLRAICGLQQASNGAIFFDGRDITYLATHETAQHGIVYMPGGQGVFPLMSVRDNLVTAGWMHRSSDDSPSLDAEIDKVLDFFPRLRERLDVQAGTMSGGEQQMLALGQAFLMKPRLLMIDELSLGLAPAVVEQLLEAIRGMRDEGITVMLVEQSLNVALTVADRAVFMEKGEIAFDGPTEELLARPDLVRSVFMGGAGSGGSVPGARQRPVLVDEANERLLQCEGLSVGFGGLQVLDDVSIHVGAGEVVGIIGPNGAGKTTLFDLLSGYTAPDAGTVLLDDVDITAMSPDARARLGLGRAFQNARLFPPLTVRENIAVALEKRANRSPLMAALWMPSVRRSERKLMSRVDGFIELLGLTAYADKFVRELSTGTRRAVEVACQMAAEPKVLLLDEPSSGLAQAETEALGPALLRIVRETGCGMLVIEHDLPLVAGISDRLIAMELGRVVTTGTPTEVTTDPRVLASYLAASADVIERSGSRVGSVLATIAGDASRAAAGPTRTSSRKADDP